MRPASAGPSSTSTSRRRAARVSARYIEPVLTYGSPRAPARRRASVLLPLPAAPSIATTRSISRDLDVGAERGEEAEEAREGHAADSTPSICEARGPPPPPRSAPSPSGGRPPSGRTRRRARRRRRRGRRRRSAAPPEGAEPLGEDREPVALLHAELRRSFERDGRPHARRGPRGAGPRRSRRQLVGAHAHRAERPLGRAASSPRVLRAPRPPSRPPPRRPSSAAPPRRRGGSDSADAGASSRRRSGRRRRGGTRPRTGPPAPPAEPLVLERPVEEHSGVRRRSGAPSAASARSVWSRVGTGSRRGRVPRPRAPARRTALFTWALGTAASNLIPRRPARDRRGAGARRLSSRPPPSPGAARPPAPSASWTGSRPRGAPSRTAPRPRDRRAISSRCPSSRRRDRDRARRSDPRPSP